MQRDDSSSASIPLSLKMRGYRIINGTGKFGTVYIHSGPLSMPVCPVRLMDTFMHSLLFSITLFAVLVIIPSNELCYSSRASYALSWYCSWDLVKLVEFYRVEGMYMCGYTFARFFVRDPVPCLIFLFPALCFAFGISFLLLPYTQPLLSSC